MKVSVRTKGGVLGTDRQVEIDDARVTVVEDGQRHEGTIGRNRADRLADIAGRVVRLPENPIGSAPDAVDAGYTEIEIADPGVNCRVHLPAGADAPEVIWDLLDAVEAAGAETTTEVEPNTFG